MSKIFKILGNFSEESLYASGGNVTINAKWSTPDPSFSGKIVVDEETHLFYGYCDELYEIAESESVNRARYLVGAINEEKRRLAFYKMSNYPSQCVLRYCIDDYQKEGENGCWWTFLIGNFFRQGGAKFTIEEETFSETEVDNIEQRFSQLDKSVNKNGIFFDSCDICKELVDKDD